MSAHVGAFRFELPPEDDERLGIAVYASGSFEAKPRELALFDRTIDHFAIGHIAAGRGYLESTSGGRHAIGPGTVYWLFPEDPHSIVPEERWVERWVTFGGPLAAAYERTGLLDRRRPVADGRAIPSLPTLFDDIIDTLAARGPLASLTAAALLQRILVLSHGARTGLLRTPPTKSSPAARAVRLIEKAALDGISPRDVAKAVGLSYAAMRKQFRDQTGLSMKEFILRAKLRHAKEMLAQGSENIEAIASHVGIPDPFYFSRLFRRYEGMSPRAYRQRSRFWARGGDE